LQACQAVHAAIEFALAFPDAAAAAPAVVVLAAPDELSLVWLRDDAVTVGLRVAAFHEPDLDGALTALALEPAAGRLVGGLPLALAGFLTSSGRGEVRT
jgi:hypothetical protein